MAIMSKSESIKELATALAKAQIEIKNPPFDSKNPHFKSSYASLASVRDAIIPVFARNGLSVIQNISSRENGVLCSNIILHSSGEWIETDPFEVPADKHNAHGYGSACTYARRFSLMALACVVGDEDDDGNEAVKPKAGGNFADLGGKDLKHKPTDGAGCELSDDRVKALMDIATLIKDQFETEDHENMFVTYSNIEDKEERMYLWTLLASQIRTKLKAMKEERAA